MRSTYWLLISYLFFIVLIIVALSGCATTRKFNTWQRQNFERGAYADALDVLASAVPESILNECGYIFNAPIPPTISVKTMEDLKTLHSTNLKVMGFYRKYSQEVFYLKGEFNVLKHEYFHYLNDISKKNEVCYDQLIAYLGVWGDTHRKSARKWRRAYRKERTRRVGQ